jgi:hypothetical protein
MIEAVDHDEERDHHRQEVERQADAVDTDEVTALDNRDPRRLSNKLHRSGLTKVESEQREDADQKRCPRGDQGDHLDECILALRHEQHYGNADERQECADAQ